MTAATHHQAILMVGPPGVGKGTQSKVIGLLPGFFHAECGGIFRNLNPESKPGRLFQEYSRKGDLVPDSLVVDIFLHFLEDEEKNGHYHPGKDLLLMDGIPRTLEQAHILTSCIRVLKIIDLECRDSEVMVQRIVERQKSGHRPDDSDVEVIRHRFAVYHQKTEPLLAFYPSEIIARVEANQPPLNVLLEIIHHLMPLVATPAES